MISPVSQRWRTHRSLYRPAGEVIERFWRHVDKDGPVPTSAPHLGPCWIWTASLVRGYGQFRLDGHQRKAHRVSWAIANGETPGELCVLHRCDVPACVNPQHLFLGTNQENTADKVAKSRQARGTSLRERIRLRTPRGEMAPSARLSAAQVIEIRTCRSDGRQALASRYGVTPQAIDKILSGRSWSHLRSTRG